MHLHNICIIILTIFRFPLVSETNDQLISYRRSLGRDVLSWISVHGATFFLQFFSTRMLYHGLFNLELLDQVLPIVISQ